MARNLLNDPVYQTSTPLAFRWGPAQLKPILDRLGPMLLGTRTDEMRLAVAGVAMSVVHAYKLTGKGVYYGRSTNFYNVPRRYRDGDPLFTWHYVTNAITTLEARGLIETHTGHWGTSHGHGWQSAAVATAELVELIGPVISGDEQRALPESFEPIVLRRREIPYAGASDLKDYVDTVETVTMRTQVEAINATLAQLQVFANGEQLEGPRGRRIFNDSFDRNGRFYFQGDSVQNMRRGERGFLKIVIDGTVHEAVELDYRSLHATMAYTESKIPVPQNDLYAIEGYQRGLVKQTFLTMLNAQSRNDSIKAVTEQLKEDREFWSSTGITEADRAQCRPVAVALVNAIETAHPGVQELFGSDCGARFMRTDSDMAIEVMLEMINRTGRCPLSIHDSFIVADIDEDSLLQTMDLVAEAHGLSLGIDRKH